MGRFRGDLPERSLRFAVAVVALADDLPNRNASWTVGRPLVRSGTSVGANLREAHHAISIDDFLHRCAIARKEASETRYWIELCVKAGLLTSSRAEQELQEATELIRILSAIVWQTRKYVKRCAAH